MLQFHYAYLEQACGAPLDSISAINWDQNETFSQFGGPVCLVPGGYSKVIQRLAKGIDVRFNTQVGNASLERVEIFLERISDQHVYQY